MGRVLGGVRRAGRVRRTVPGVLVVAVLSAALAAVPVATAPTAAAYDVCSDGACTHEYMATRAFAVFQDALGATRPDFVDEIFDNWSSIAEGITHEDELDHVYQLSGLFGGIVTITHFWESDFGPTDPVTNVFGAFPNNLAKARALWAMALGAYAQNQIPEAYHWFGHVVHLLGDSTIPTHVHDDMHGPDFFDDDSFEEWMSVPGPNGSEPVNAQVTPVELQSLMDDGPITVPSGNTDPLHYLLYTTNQIADFFASEGGITESGSFNGDTFDPLGFVQGELDTLAATVPSPRVSSDLDDNDSGNNNDDGDLGRIREHSYLRGIRSIAGLFSVFLETVRQTQLTLIVEHVQELEDHDYVCPGIVCGEVEVSDPDYYTKVTVNGVASQNRGDEIESETIDPNWGFGVTVGTTGSVPIHVEIWDNDGDEDDANPFGGSDDISDIDPDDEDDDQTLDFNVNLAACLTRAPGAITGELSGACGQGLGSDGDNGLEASHVRVRVVMSQPPVARAGGPYTTIEGANVTLNGTGSTDPDSSIATYAWDLDDDGACDDIANDPTPDFTAVGQDGVTSVRLCVTDTTGLTDDDTTTVTVTNVTPAVSLTGGAATTENTASSISGVVTDPGWLDPLSATVDWGDGTGPLPLSGVTENARPDASFTYTSNHTYGDNGSFDVEVCGSDVDSSACRSVALTVTNTSPTATIDLSGATLVNGVPTIIAHSGQSVSFSGGSADPGSDDLTQVWNWGDSTPTSTQVSLVNPPDPDPAASPSVQPRNVTFDSSHAFGEACAYETTFSVGDDDAGSAAATAQVIILGNNHPNRPHGYWHQQFRYYVESRGTSAFSSARLACYLQIVGFMSRVFSETAAAATFPRALDVLRTNGTSDMRQLFDQQLLAAWLNFANGAMEPTRLVDTNLDGTADTPFLQAAAAAEALRLAPATTRAEFDRQKRIIESWLALP